MWQMIGLAAAFLTMLSFVPQIIKTVKTKSVKDVSVGTISQLSLGVFLWILYGIHLKNFIIILANVVSLITMLVLLYFYFNYRKASQ